ncbi:MULTISPECIES: hypothetical protein [Sphingobium]|uniref:hypothetical protein n=1 Tax=Sphingobium TaxID=165695 RepID=UPI0015EC95D8|nr:MULTISPECIES: hypothetical protein [Sphingobium]MCW2363868.1 hypothetical protein [Sphingobium sp. B10D3B]MCW2402735.1 hypothetical protein [Sphingobium sp. B10D7B]MCW2409714.1 hypothetical protein [Sphingobium xanthum]
MPVNIAGDDVSPLTSPPAPIPIPDKPLFHEKTLSDGRQIWVSAPQPDRLSFVIPLSKYVYAKHIPKETSVPDFVGLVVEQLTNPKTTNVDLVGKSKYANQGQDWRATTLSMGKRESRVHFSYYKHKTLGISLRVEMNPRKLGPLGFKHLVQLLAPLFDMKGMAEAARVTRLDIAIDVVGVHVSEVIARHKKEGKRSLYMGNDGRLETINIHRKRPAFKQKFDELGEPIKAFHPSQPAEKVLVRIYDRMRERTAIGQAPPFGDAPITRIEIVKDRFKKTHLASLAGLPDPLAEVRVGYGPSQTSGSHSRWHRYWHLARSLTPEEAGALLVLPKGLGQRFWKSSQVPTADLSAPETSWEGWHTGLKSTGLSLLLPSGSLQSIAK